MKKRYEIPLKTEVEIINENSKYFGRKGIIGVKDPCGLYAYNVWFNTDSNDKEFDCFMEDEFIPRQNIITIDNLEYETLSGVFSTWYLYETDKVLIKMKNFSVEEIEAAIVKHAKIVEQIYDDSFEIGEEGIETGNRGKIIDLLEAMLNDDFEKGESDNLRETIMLNQWIVDGLRRHVTGSCKKPKRYFNPEARIDVLYIKEINKLEKLIRMQE